MLRATVATLIEPATYLGAVTGDSYIMSDLIRRVAIVGGTHGNEWTGIHLVKKFAHFAELIYRPSFETFTLLANPKAVEANRRYIDRDLNRCFDTEDLSNLALTGYEDRRAKEIAAQLGPKDCPNADAIIDLHSTTANMGLTILPSSTHLFNLRLCAYLSKFYPDVRVLLGVQCSQNSPMLRSLSPLGCTIEVGAVSQGILDARYVEQTEMLVFAMLDYLDAMNRGTPLSIPASLTVYQAISYVDYPRDSVGELQAAIHPRLQFKDYEPLHQGDPMFLTLAGKSIFYQGESTVFPVFINEAAYYEKGIAMVLTEKQQIEMEVNS
jgi:succinylglutamate desuccinylase